MTKGTFDVVVVGGGAAGVAAAVGAARCGAQVALVEMYGFLGGAATNSSVSTLDGYFDQNGEQVVRGVGGEVLDRLVRLDAAASQRLHTGNTVVPFDRETLKIVLDDLLDEAGVTAYLHSRIIAAEVLGDRVTAVDLAHRGGQLTLEAGSFVDASGDGALIAVARAGTIVAPIQERQKSTLVAVIGGVDDNAAHDRQAMLAAVDGFNATVTEVERLNVDSSFSMYNRFTGDTMLFVGDERVDALDVLDLSAAERHARLTIRKTVAVFRKHLSGWEHARVILSGPQIGLREVRRLRGRYTITADDAVQAHRHDDSIGRAGWPVEDHSGDTPRYVPIKDKASFDIRYPALVSSTHENLWAAGRLVSADRDAFCSLRVMATAFATGHAAGVAAALATKSPAHDVAAIRTTLTDQRALL